MYEILLLVFVSFHHASSERFIVVTTPNDPCPGKFTGEPCLTLTQFVSGTYTRFLSDPSIIIDVTLDLVPGKHEILGREDLRVDNIESFVLRATGEVIIDCRNHLFNIHDVEDVEISGIKFVNCINIEINLVTKLRLVNTSIGYSQRLLIEDTLQATITNSSFSESMQTLHVVRTSITVDQCTFSTNCIAIYGENSNITANQSAFRMNIANCIAPPSNLLHSGAAIHLVLSYNPPQLRGRYLGKVLTIINSTFEGNTAQREGGAVYVSGTNVVVRRSRFVNNTARSQGGAVYIASTRSTTASTAVIEHSKFSSNHARIGGGAIYAPASVQIDHSSFDSNTAPLRGGGALYTGGRNSIITVTKSRFMSNSAAYCGVFDIDELRHEVKFEDSTFSLNTATGNSDITSILRRSGIRSDIGGVICVRNATISIVNSSFIQNSAAGYGGVMYVDDSTATVEKCAFVENTAGYSGGVTYTEQHRILLTIDHSSFTGNKAQNGDGGVVYVERAHSQVSISESSFYSNSATERGGVMVVYGGLLEINSTEFGENAALKGGIGSACNSQVVIPDGTVTSKDPELPFCNLYDEYVRPYNRTTTMASLPETTETTTGSSTPTFPYTTYSGDHSTSDTPPNVSTTVVPSTVHRRGTTLTAEQIVSTAKATHETTASPSTTISTDSLTTDAITDYPVVYFTLRGHVYFNNSAVSLQEVGEGERALVCKTNKEDCCGTPPNRFGEFYYPSGDMVPIRNRQDRFYRHRGDGEIYLNRRVNTVTPVGSYSCVIPDANGTIHILYIDLL